REHTVFQSPREETPAMSRRIITLAAAAAATALIASLAGCATTPASEGGGGASAENETVRIGVVGKSDEQWPAFVEAAAEEGITVELVDFGSYEQPNPALTEGELDLNQFQHIVYLAQYNDASGKDLQPIG